MAQVAHLTKFHKLCPGAASKKPPLLLSFAAPHTDLTNNAPSVVDTNPGGSEFDSRSLGFKLKTLRKPTGSEQNFGLK